MPANGTDLPAVGWIGVGNLGDPICRNLIGAGIALTVYDIDPARTAALAEAGAAVAGSPAETAAASEMVFSALPTNQALKAVAAELTGTLKPGQVYADISTVSPDASAEVADILASSGALYLRSTVSGSTANAVAGTLGIFCSGPREAYDKALPVLGKIGNRSSYNGEGEEARILKLLVNILVAATPVLVGEALAFGRRSGLDWDAMIDAIASSVAASPVIGYKVDTMKSRDWTPAATVDLVAKDMTLALDWGREQGVPMPFASLTRQLVAGFQASGDGEKDFFYALTWPERMMGEGGDS